MAASDTEPFITEDLRRWIEQQAAAGCSRPDLLAAMRASGWDEDVAREALRLTLPVRPPPPAAVLPPAPEPDLAASPVQLCVEGHATRVLLSMQHPRLVVFGGLLTDDECDQLVAAAQPRLLRSQTVQTDTGASEVNVARTSQGMFFDRGETPLVARIERRIAALLRWPLDHGEGLQVLRYEPGAEYRPHHDYFDPALPGTPSILARGGQRVGTVVIYLRSPEAGGATVFPDAGLEVAPVKGNAVFFAYPRPLESTATLHGGAPVRAGEKWVATKWLRERVFT